MRNLWVADRPFAALETAVALPDGPDGPAGFVGIHRDLTDRRERERLARFRSAKALAERERRRYSTSANL